MTDDEFDDEAATLPGYTFVPHAASPPRVLLAEDDAAMRALVTEVLRADGYEVVDVADAEQMTNVLTERGADAWPNEPFDVIVTEDRMPHGDGLDVVAALRRAGYETPILLMSGFDDDELRARADNLEAMVIHKPFPLPAFRAAVDVLVSLSPHHHRR